MRGRWFAILVVATLLVATAVFIFLPDYLVTRIYGFTDGQVNYSADARIKAVTDTRASVITFLTGLVGIFAAVAAYLNYRQTRRIADEKLWVESFQKACEMVSKDKPSSIQAGGVALLEFLVRNAEPFYWPAIEVLADHLRSTIPRESTSTGSIPNSSSAVLNCFGDPSWRKLEDESTFYIDLSKLRIRDAWLISLEFHHLMMHDCVFEGTDLTRARFNDVQFDRTEFINCDFEGANFANCQFDGCLFIKPKNLNDTFRKQLEKASCTFSFH